MLFHHIVLLLMLSSSLALDYPVVKTSLGTVQGYYQESYHNRKYSAFEGIPFAQPPTGNLRFKDPVEVQPWKETLNANRALTCIQGYVIGAFDAGEEDCLTLNVYVPKENPSIDDNLDVIVHIHGGAFMVGSPAIAGPGFLMDRNVVYVSINYRLGPLGFLSTEDDVVPGNMGLKDQALALRWVQKHIKQFGGNPHSITLTGVSAGGVAVHFHYFSKLSQGLFHRAISHSGTVLAPWGLQENALATTKSLAAKLGCDNVSNKVLIDCMQEKPVNEIIDKVKQFFPDYGLLPLSLFAPVIEKPSAGAFLVDHPIKLLQSGNFNDLPWISSIAGMEGSIAKLILGSEIFNMDDKWNENAHNIMDYNYSACDSDKLSIAQKIKEQYFGKEQISFDKYETFIKLVGDRYFVHSHEKSTRLQASFSKSKVFAYTNTYKSSLMQGFRTDDEKIFSDGVGHGADCQLTYSMNFSGALIIKSGQLNERDTLMKDLLLDLIISFIKADVPKIGSVELEPIDNSKDFVYLSIADTDNIKMTRVKELTPTEFWDSLPIRENEKFSQTKCNDNLEPTHKTEL